MRRSALIDNNRKMNLRTLILALALLLGGLFPEVVQAQNFRIFADSVQGSQGSQVIVPIRANDFVNLIGAQGSVQWNTSIATYDTVFQFGLPGLAPASFGISQVAAGRLAFSWDDATLNGVTVADSSVLFAIRFNVVGTPGTFTPVTFSNSPTQLEFTNNTFSVIPFTTGNGQVEISIGSGCLVAGLTAGQQIACDSTTNTFSQEVIVTHFNAPATGSLDINGQLFPITSSPQSVYLTGLASNGQPVNVSAFFTDSASCSRSETALFTAPIACSSVILFADSVQGAPASQVIVPVRVKQFNALIGAQGSVQWNTAIATFDTVFQYGLPGMNIANFGLAQVNAGRMSFSWDDNTLQGVTVPDSTIIFAIRYDVVGPQGGQTAIEFVNTPTTLEFTDHTFSIIGHSTTPGEIEIPITGCVITNLQAGIQTACDPNTNAYTQEVTVEYVNTPASGSLQVNGQSFPITSSPQTVILTGLPSTGQAVAVSARFTADTTCVLSVPALFNAPSTCADFRIFADSVQGAPATQVIVPVRVENFLSLVSAQGSITWDTAVATFDTIFQYGLPNLGPASFGISNAPAGTLSFSWDDSTFTGVTVPDSSVIFGIRFNVVGTQGMQTPVSFVNTPTPLEFTNSAFVVIPHDTTSGEIEIPITSCVVLDLTAGFQFPCDSASNSFGQEIIVTYANAPASGNLVVNGQAFPITSSPQVVILTGIPSNGQPVTVSAWFDADTTCIRTEVGLMTASAPCGTFIIFGDSVQGANGTQVIVPIRASNFDQIIGVQGTIQWDLAVATFDTIFQYGLPSMSPANFGISMVNAGQLAFSWDDPTLIGVTVPDSTILFAIRYNIVGGPGSLTPIEFINSTTTLEFTDYAFNVLAYDTIPGEIEVPITGCAITNFQAGTQTACDSITNTYSQDITITYQSNPATGTLLVNGQSFPITTSPQTVTLTSLPSNGISVNVTALFSADTTCFRTEYALFTAPVNCLSTNLTIFGDSVIAAQFTQVVVPIRVRNFIDIIGAQGSIQWNTAIATYDTVFQFGLPGMSPPNFGTSQIAAGRLAFSWDDATLQGVTVPDSTVIFGIRFNVIGNIGTQTPISFVNSPTLLEFSDKFFVVQPHDTIPGEIRIPVASIQTDSLANTFYCAGDTVQVSFTINGVFNSGNVFSAELSDAVGSFAAPTVIGSITGTMAGTIPVVIPYVPSGSGYRIRVVATNPVVVGIDNGVDITISNIQTVVNTSICDGDSIFLDGMFQTMGGTFVDTLAAANSCDSIVTTILAVLLPVQDTVMATICGGDSL
ncbi:MAG TPA: hypothetical protein ENJ82_00670, partial [Bacteroidetes bacterium]|nr:hypothetical protein [Bacteroidota bacterium]